MSQGTTLSAGSKPKVTVSLTNPGPPPVKRARSSSLIQQNLKQSSPGRLAIGFIGAGNMARAITEGLIGSGEDFDLVDFMRSMSLCTANVCTLQNTVLLFEQNDCEHGISGRLMIKNY